MVRLIIFLIWAGGELLHIIYSLQDGAIVLLIVGFFIPPVGIINGFGQLFGLW